jgi:GWxTD domain-containing protein
LTFYSVRRALAGLVLTLGAVSVAYAGRPPYENFELIHPLLGPQHSQWLVGPISWMATRQEIDDYLALTTDEAAQRFIEEWWARRNPYPQRPDNTVRELFEERAQKADSLYPESGLPGRRTDRGVIYVLYGEPEEVDYQVGPERGDPLVEVWTYPKGAPEGLDGEKPNRGYRFIQREGVTRFYERQNPRQRQDVRRRLPDPRRP